MFYFVSHIFSITARATSLTTLGKRAEGVEREAGKTADSYVKRGAQALSETTVKRTQMTRYHLKKECLEPELLASKAS